MHKILFEFIEKKYVQFIICIFLLESMYLPSQVMKDFSVENLETTPSTFLSKFSSDIYLSRINNYWGSIFTLYLTWETFSLVFVLPVFFSFLLSSFFSFSVGIFLDRHWRFTDSREQRGNPYFSCFLLPLAHKHSISLSLLITIY